MRLPGSVVVHLRLGFETSPGKFAYSGKPLTGRNGIGGSEQCISDGGTPNRCPGCNSHAISHKKKEASWVVPMVRKNEGKLLFTFFVPIRSFPERDFAPGPPRDNDRQLGRPITSPVFFLLRRISISQRRSLPASDRLQENIGSERQGSVQLTVVASIWCPRSKAAQTDCVATPTIYLRRPRRPTSDRVAKTSPAGLQSFGFISDDLSEYMTGDLSG